MCFGARSMVACLHCRQASLLAVLLAATVAVAATEMFRDGRIASNIAALVMLVARTIHILFGSAMLAPSFVSSRQTRLVSSRTRLKCSGRAHDGKTRPFPFPESCHEQVEAVLKNQRRRYGARRKLVKALVPFSRNCIVAFLAGCLARHSFWTGTHSCISQGTDAWSAVGPGDL